MVAAQPVPPSRPAGPAGAGRGASGGGPIDLVLEGGGMKGIALAGALEVLEERGYEIARVAGSSAGAIAGVLIAAGIPAATQTQILRETDFRRFADGPPWTRLLPGKALEILLHQGVHRGDAVAAWLEEQLDQHARWAIGGAAAWRFADLRWEDPPGGPPYRLVVTATDLSAGQLRHLPRDAPAYGKDPDALRVIDAVRASVTIPFFFRPLRWRTRTGGTAWIVDGGLLSNYPVDVFDVPPGQVPRWPTFGIKLSGRHETDYGVANEIRGPLTFMKAVVDTVTGFYDRLHIESSHAQARTIFIDTDDIRPTDFALTPAQREMLHQRGRDAAIEFLDGADDRPGWDFDRYVAQFRTGPAAPC